MFQHILDFPARVEGRRGRPGDGGGGPAPGRRGDGGGGGEG